MTVSAFIGHSFTENDESVIRRFLDYFNTLTFLTWENAQCAELGDIKDKILEKMREKDIFIAICTEDKRSFRSSCTKRSCFISKKVFIEENNCEKNPSDWILLEIGVAIGMEKKIILLIEEGVKIPNELLGNKEYITFSKESPSKSFKKFNEMIFSLPEIAKTTKQQKVESSDPKDQRNFQEKRQKDRITTPKPGWDLNNYITAISCSLNFNEELVDKIIDQFNVSNLAKNLSLKASFDAKVLMCKFIHNSSDVIQELQCLMNEHPDNVDVIISIATVYKLQNQPEQAMRLLDNALLRITENEGKIHILREAGVLAKNMNDQSRSNESKRYIFHVL